MGKISIYLPLATVLCFMLFAVKGKEALVSRDNDIKKTKE